MRDAYLEWGLPPPVLKQGGLPLPLKAPRGEAGREISHVSSRDLSQEVQVRIQARALGRRGGVASCEMVSGGTERVGGIRGGRYRTTQVSDLSGYRLH
jgi:hypothetical protein